jgi:hypothetical protein
MTRQRIDLLKREQIITLSDRDVEEKGASKDTHGWHGRHGQG